MILSCKLASSQIWSVILLISFFFNFSVFGYKFYVSFVFELQILLLLIFSFGIFDLWAVLVRQFLNSNYLFQLLLIFSIIVLMLSVSMTTFLRYHGHRSHKGWCIESKLSFQSTFFNALLRCSNMWSNFLSICEIIFMHG